MFSFHLLRRHRAALPIFASSGMETKKESCDRPCGHRGARSGFPGKGCNTSPSQVGDAPADRDPQDVCNPAEAPVPARPTKSPREVVQGRGEFVPEREHKVKPGWTGTQGTAGTVCMGPGHHFVASTSREVKHHSPCHGLQPMPPQVPNMLTPCQPFCIVHPASVLISREV